MGDPEWGNFFGFTGLGFSVRVRFRQLSSRQIRSSIDPHIPLSSDRQQLSYGVCLEVRGEIITTVMCCIVYDRCAQS